MKKKSIILMVICMLFLFSILTVNASSASMLFSVYRNSTGDYFATEHGQRSYSQFTLSASDMKKNIFQSENTKKVYHKHFVPEAGYYDMEFVEAQTHDSNSNLPEKYTHYMVLPGGSGNGNYGGTPCYVYVQEGNYHQGTSNVYLKTYAMARFTASYADFWNKEEIKCMVYGGEQNHVQTRTYDDMTPAG